MNLSRVKTWISGNILTSSDLNAEFNNIINHNFDNVDLAVSPALKLIRFENGIDGDILYFDSVWKRMAKSDNGKFLFMVDGLPKWAARLVTELDYMEYATDEAAQTAYVSDDATPAQPVSWDLMDEDCSAIDDWDDLDDGNGVSEVDPAGQFRMDANTASGTSAAIRARDIAGYPATYTLEIKLYHDLIGEPPPNEDMFLFQGFQGDEYFTFRAATTGLFIGSTASGWTEVGTNLVKSGGSKEWQTWRFLVNLTANTCDVYLDDSTHNWEKVGTAIPCSTTYSGLANSTRIYQFGYTTNDMVSHTDWIKISTGLTAPTFNLQCYSEDTIKEQGSYSLKGIAAATDSLNDTLTRTVDPIIDLSGKKRIIFYAYASRTGSNFKIGFHDSGGNTVEHTINIASPSTWEKQTVDISAVADADKDAIDEIKVTILNADEDSIFFLDNVFGEVIA